MPDPNLRRLPAVEIVLRHAAFAELSADVPHVVRVAAVRAELEAAREILRGTGAAPDPDAIARAAASRAAAESRPVLRRVLNATGIVLHTNLGRAPLATEARAAVAAVAAGYSSLEYDLARGSRGDRGAGVERWVCRLTGAQAGLVVNNGAAAILLALSALAAGRKVVVSRGELVEIGGSFRVPEIMEKSGAALVEVGATNRTHLRDYARALERHGREVGAVLRVHPSNFRVEGFTARPDHGELARLARKHKVPLIEDLGSGALVDLERHGLDHEPTVAESLAAGSDVVTFSGDKLLGGAQAGFVVGGEKLIRRIGRDPFARAMRADKLALAALEATLPLYADPERAAQALPVLAMLRATPEELAPRAEWLAGELVRAVPGLEAEVIESAGEVGGGSMPQQRLPGPVVSVRQSRRSAQALEALARAADPPVVVIVRAGRLRLDPRTLPGDDLAAAAASLGAAWRN